MPVNVAINGFGRIGRRVLREALRQDNLRIVAINDLTKPETIAHLFKYDSVHRTLEENVSVEGGYLVAGRQKAKLFAEKDPSKLPWKDLGVDIVMECTGLFTDREKAAVHLSAGAKKVIISAPSKDADITICMGVNHALYDARSHHVVSNASCTTNCLAPVAKVLDEAYGIVKGLMVTIHSYTNDQNILDLPHKDLRRARAAALSQIPTSTGAAKALGLVLPQLKGKLDGYSVRVPTPDVSLVDLTVELAVELAEERGKPITRDDINERMKQAAQGALKGILDYTTEQLVSQDYIGNTMSAIVDAELTQVIAPANGGNPLAKVVAWYDNESGFSARMLDLALHMSQKSAQK